MVNVVHKNGGSYWQMTVTNIQYPEMFLNLANEIGETRTMLSRKYYKKGTEKYRGENENKISSLGILGELIARHYLTENNMPFKAAPLIALKPIAEPDIYLLTDKNGVDVKSLEYYTKELYVNKDAHNNADKRPDYYWFIKIDKYNCNANFYFVDSDDVNGWNIEPKRYTDVYCKSIEGVEIHQGIPEVLQYQEWMKIRQDEI